MDSQAITPLLALGIAGILIFYGRFVLQWIASERSKKSVMPSAFWYMSGFGSVILLTYGILNQSLLGTIGQNINVVIYGRNITHIWREKGILTPRKSAILHLAMFTFATIGLIAVARLAYIEWQVQGGKPAAEARVAWGWLILGLVGQILFAARFILQWVATERAKRSVVPNLFWYLSFFAATFQCAAFFQRDQLVFATGMAFTIFIYARNIWFIVRHQSETENA